MHVSLSIHTNIYIHITCAKVPNRTFTSSVKVCMWETRRFTAEPTTENKRMGIAAPEAYQKGPDMPTRQPMLEDIKSDAAHTHFETIAEAVNPIPTLRPAEENCSEVMGMPFPFCSLLDKSMSTGVMKMKKTMMSAQANPWPSSVFASGVSPRL